MQLRVEEIATRQLESAISMYAYDFDEVAVHTVACTAYELLVHRLGQGKFLSTLNSKQKAKLKQLQFKENNVFKHGQLSWKNVDRVTFEGRSTEDILMFACEANLRGPEEYRLQCAYLYLLHYSFRNSNVFGKEYTEEILRNVHESGVTLPLSDKATLKSMLTMIKNWRLPAGVKV